MAYVACFSTQENDTAISHKFLEDSICSQFGETKYSERIFKIFMLFVYYFIIDLWISCIINTQNVNTGNNTNNLSIIE